MAYTYARRVGKYGKRVQKKDKRKPKLKAARGSKVKGKTKYPLDQNRCMRGNLKTDKNQYFKKGGRARRPNALPAGGSSLI